MVDISIEITMFDLFSLQCQNKKGGSMSLEHAKMFINEKLQSDPDFRDRVVDFIIYRNFLGSSDDQKNIVEEAGLTLGQRDEYCSSEAKDKVNECSTAKGLHGYEHWVG